MQKNVFQIAGGILEIIAGALWLYVCCVVNNFVTYFGLKLEIIQIILPICFIVCGALACTGKRSKKDVVVYGIINIAFIGLQFYMGSYVGLGMLQMVLLLIAALLFFISPKQ